MAAALRVCLSRSSHFIVRRMPLNPSAFAISRFFSDRIIDPPYLGPSIPNYRVRENESIEMKRARLLYQSRKRGMLENGLLLSTFADEFLDKLDESLLEQYDKLINKPTNDWDLYYWMTDNQPTPEEYDTPVMDMMKKHAKNERRDVRIRQPALKFDEAA